MQPCKAHPSQYLAYYCDECHATLCADCKVLGDHSRGPRSEHVLQPVQRAVENLCKTLADVRWQSMRNVAACDTAVVADRGWRRPGGVRAGALRGVLFRATCTGASCAMT